MQPLQHIDPLRHYLESAQVCIYAPRVAAVAGRQHRSEAVRITP